MSTLSDEDLELVRIRLLDRTSVAAIAKELGRAPSVITRAVHELATRNATGLKDYDIEARKVLLNKAFEKCEWLVSSVTDEIRFEKLVNSLRTLMEIRQSFDAGRDIPDARNLSLNIILNQNNIKAAEEDDIPELHEQGDVDGEILEPEPEDKEDEFKLPKFHPENPFSLEDP